jgi:hypothetical protein
MTDDNDRIRHSLKESLIALRGTLHAMNHAVPSLVVVATFVSVGIIWALALSSTLMVGATTFLVVAISILVYSRMNNYGEAALALVAGLLTVFTVEWTVGRFVAFSVAWLGFSFFALMISSIKIAMVNEDIYLQSSLLVAEEDEAPKVIEARLQAISASEKIRSLGPTERAEVIRVFAYRKVPIDTMEALLHTVRMLSTLTRVGHQEIGNFMADFYHMIGKANSKDDPLPTLDGLYAAIKDSPADPTEFITAFRRCRRLVMSEGISMMVYLRLLHIGLEAGVAPEEMYSWLSEQIATIRRAGTDHTLPE